MREPAPAELREYERAKFELADILRAVSLAGATGGASPESDVWRRDVGELFTRLAADRFVLLVAGRFSRGKTTLMNAVLGMDRLPTGILPLTSVITSVSYGSVERVQLESESGALRTEISMQSLPDYITERGNPGNMRRIRIAHVALPAEILRRGLQLVDSPGLGSAIRDNSRTTEAFFAEADAAIVVSSFDGPLSDDEMRAIHTFEETRRPVFVVLNKQDLVPPAARAEVLAFARGRVAGERSGPPWLFAVSAREALAARLNGDTGAFAASGVAELEAALVGFLVEQKRAVLIAGVCDRLQRLIDQAACDTSEGALQMRLARVRERWRPTPGAGEPPTAAAGGSRMEDCLLCARVRETLFDFLRKYQYELTVSPQARERLTAAGGLCPAHLWLYASMSADRDICLALAPLVRCAARTLAGGPPSDAGDEQAAPAARCPPAATCGPCAIQRKVEQAAIDELSQRVSEERPPSVCLPHLRLIAGAVRSAAVDATLQDSRARLLSALSRRQGIAAERLAEDMQRYALKRDGTRRALVTDEEDRAAQRALAFLAGARGTASLK